MNEPKNSQKRKPKNMRAAAKRGWHIVDITHKQYRDKHNLSFLGLLITCDRAVQGRYLSSYMASSSGGSKFAFEDEADAAWFIMKFL